MDPNNSKTAPRTSTPPPPYDEGPGIYPASCVYSNEYITQHQSFTPECIIESTLGPMPVHMFCPTCHNYIITETNELPSNEAYLCCMLIFVVGCTLCSCLPFFMKSFQKVDHKCPQCTSYIGTYKP
ncbi:lipopolysaccharide-induced tumor necrosis factor-alpha factor homolog [Rhopalosiphum padi]|uniref:lipopolysaccharide-induced tumor necrosis factor-alpha factor homolog n=1 Tax=Rhopalosiphum padi TaxID=40932 RepID=UPI00298D9F8C|nr:lipopolysaccharide-induced tumor necrosis factor-alpha factor homolog [Rhopalosiphum padi]XP_060834744.1 lipopolysaccharide-induced tumor necrosis factor-alpha factor homolog [Rhopalosiphum padi]